jgi:hypothetical protein
MELLCKKNWILTRSPIRSDYSDLIRIHSTGSAVSNLKRLEPRGPVRLGFPQQQVRVNARSRGNPTRFTAMVMLDQVRRGLHVTIKETGANPSASTGVPDTS